MAIQRRRRVFAVAVLVAAATALAPASAGAAAVTARAADSFVESIGVNVHLGYTDTPYVKSFSTVEQRLGELGVRHVRDGLIPSDPAEYQAIRELAAHGIKSDLIVGNPSEPESALAGMLATLKSPELAGAVDAVEGYNEPSVSTEAAKAQVIEHQRRLFEGINAEPTLASIPVLGPSIIRGEQSKLGDVSTYLDDGNIHSYPEGGPPEEKVNGNVTKAEEYNSKAKPIYATETGYTNATQWNPAGPGENRPISEEGAATYMPRLFFEYWTRHIARTYSYELLDDHAEPKLEQREDHFGLLRNDLSPKPAFTALHNTIAILADPGAATKPGALEYTLSAGGATLHSTLLEKRDGSFYLALWRLESVWNPETKQPIAALVEPETITLPGGVSSSAVYEPNKSSAPVSSGGATKSLSVGVGAAVTIVKLIPATPAPPAKLRRANRRPVNRKRRQSKPCRPDRPPRRRPPRPAATQTVVLAPPFMRRSPCRLPRRRAARSPSSRVVASPPLAAPCARPGASSGP